MVKGKYDRHSRQADGQLNLARHPVLAAGEFGDSTR